MRITGFEAYESPEVEVISVEVERGFASSVEGWGDGGSYDGSFGVYFFGIGL